MDLLQRLNFQFRGDDDVAGSHAGPGCSRIFLCVVEHRAPGGRRATAAAARERGEVGNLTGLNGFNSM